MPLLFQYLSHVVQLSASLSHFASIWAGLVVGTVDLVAQDEPLKRRPSRSAIQIGIKIRDTLRISGGAWTAAFWRITLLLRRSDSATDYWIALHLIKSDKHALASAFMTLEMPPGARGPYPSLVMVAINLSRSWRSNFIGAWGRERSPDRGDPSSKWRRPQQDQNARVVVVAGVAGAGRSRWIWWRRRDAGEEGASRTRVKENWRKKVWVWVGLAPA